MRGHIPIIELRLQRRKPSFVFLNDYPCKTDWASYGEVATVCTDRDPLSSLDLRFLKGLRVSISANSEQRAKSLYQLAINAGADTVAACHIQPESPHKQTGWSSVHHAAQEDSHASA